MRNIETKSRSFTDRLGGKERLKNTVEVLRGNPFAVVGHCHLDALAIVTGRQSHLATGLHGIQRIQQEIQKDLLNLPRPASSQRQRRHRASPIAPVISDDTSLPCPVATYHKVHCFIENGDEIHGLESFFFPSGKAEQALNDVLTAVNIVFDFLEMAGSNVRLFFVVQVLFRLQ
ncbi:MAG: hypothetical protein QF473_26545, partial [Planctomycetota bacterium]|nr:hypothetical protein [Planctomycetota bacterium]